MARATYAETVKKWGGVDPGGWDSSSIGDVCTQTDAEIDAKASPSTFGTGTDHTEFANMLAYRRVNHGRWSAGDMMTAEPVVWTREMEDWFQRLLTDTTVDSVGSIPLQDTGTS